MEGPVWETPAQEEAWDNQGPRGGGSKWNNSHQRKDVSGGGGQVTSQGHVNAFGLNLRWTVLKQRRVIIT